MVADTVGDEQERVASSLGNKIPADSGATTEGKSSESIFELWMIAKKQSRRRSSTTKSPGMGGQFGIRSSSDHVRMHDMQDSGSRFEALNEETASHPRDQREEYPTKLQ